MRRRYYPAPLAHVVEDSECDTSERLAGRVTVPAVKDPERHPMVYVYAFALRRHAPKGCEGIRAVGDPDPDSIPEDEDGCAVFPKGQPLFWVKAGKRYHAARMELDRHNRLFLRAGGCIELARDLDPAPFYARVYHLRKWLLLIPLAIAALLLCLSLAFCGSGSGSLGFLDGQNSISGATSKPILTTSYASYSATPDTVWQAGQTRQDMVLLLPATCTVKGEEGGNPVLSSPSIAVDLNGDGEFSDSEIVYNAPDKTGYGRFLRPGSEVEHIDLTEPLAVGEYSARTIWRSVLSEDGKTPAGAATFDWRLTVE